MQKKTWHISIRFLLLLFIASAVIMPVHVFAQNPTITIGSTDIGNEVSTELTTFSASCLASVLPYVKVRASGDLSDGNGHTIPLTKLRFKITKINGTLITLLAGTNTEVTPTTSDATMYSALLSIASGNAITILYRIPQSEMTTLALYAGTYTTTLTFTTPGSTLCLGTLTTTRTLTVTVSSFIAAAATSNLTLNVNSFNYFRSSAITANHDFNVTATVPYNFRIKAGSSTLSYTPVTANNGATPNTNVNKVSVQPTNPPSGTGSTISLSSSLQNLLTTGINPPTGNLGTTNMQHTISTANMLAGFTYAGTYIASLTYEVFDTHTAPPTLATTQSLTPSVTVDVSDMGELSVNNANVTLTFGNTAAYISGRDTDITNHIKVSHTTPYDVSVKASSGNLSYSSNNIPVSIIKIGPATGQAGVSQITLSTAYQKIISAAAPVVDRNVSLRYSIAAGSVTQLLGKPAGDYTVTITYCITSP